MNSYLRFDQDDSRLVSRRYLPARFRSRRSESVNDGTGVVLIQSNFKASGDLRRGSSGGRHPDPDATPSLPGACSNLRRGSLVVLTKF